MTEIGDLSNRDDTQINSLRLIAGSLAATSMPHNASSLTSQVEKKDTPIANDRLSLYEEVSNKRDTLATTLAGLKTEDAAYHKAQIAGS